MKTLIMVLIQLFTISMAFPQLPGQAGSKQTWNEQKVKISNGLTVAYVEQGDASGLPVIFLHGYTDSWHSFETVLGSLPRNIRAIALSQRGHGNSEKPEQNYSPKQFAADLALFMKELRIPKAVIVGHSMGGMIAQRFTLDFPDLTRGLVIVGSAAAFDNNEGVREFEKQVQMLNDPVDTIFAREFQKATLYKPIDEQYFSALVNESLKLPARVWKLTLAELVKQNFAGELHKINKPTLIVWGDQDGFCLRPHQDVLQRSIRNSRLIVFEGTGHAVHWEEPKKFANSLLEFISQNQEVLK